MHAFYASDHVARKALRVGGRSALAASLSIIMALVCAAAPAARAEQELLVSSRNTNSIKRYDASTGQFVGDLVAPGSGGLVAPQDMLFGPDGSLYVTGFQNTQVLRYSPEGVFLGVFTSGYALANPTKMSYGPDGMLYVSQWGSTQNKVVRFNATTGAFIDEFTSTGINRGLGHAWDDAGNLYVASFGTGSVQKFDSNGATLGVATQPLWLVGPANVWFGAGGDLFVADWSQGAVLRFDGQNGLYKATFISGLQNVEGFAFGADDTLFLCDWTLNRINRYDASGAFLGIFADQGGMSSPNALLFTSSATPVHRATWGELKKAYR